MKMLHCQRLKEIRVSTPAENRVGNSSVRKGLTGSKALLPTTRTSDFDPRDRK